MSQLFALIGNLPYAFVPEDVIDALCQLPRNETLADLRELLFQTEDVLLSDRAMDAILQIDAEFGKSVLLELYLRPTWEWFFCYASLAYGDHSFIASLCAILLNSPNSKARYMAAVALEQLGDINVVDALTTALGDKGTDHEGRKISQQAAIALQTIKGRGYS